MTANLQECDNTWADMENMELDEATEHLCNKITKLLDMVASVKTKKLSKKPGNKWITPDLKISLKNGTNQCKAVQAGRKPKEEYMKYKKSWENY